MTVVDDLTEDLADGAGRALDRWSLDALRRLRRH